MNISKALIELLIHARKIGLPELDYQNAKELLDHNEYGLCFETIIVQLYEYEIKIDDNFYEQVKELAKQMAMEDNRFTFLKELL